MTQTDLLRKLICDRHFLASPIMHPRIIQKQNKYIYIIHATKKKKMLQASMIAGVF